MKRFLLAAIITLPQCSYAVDVILKHEPNGIRRVTKNMNKIAGLHYDYYDSQGSQGMTTVREIRQSFNIFFRTGSAATDSNTESRLRGIKLTPVAFRIVVTVNDCEEHRVEGKWILGKVLNQTITSTEPNRLTYEILIAPESDGYGNYKVEFEYPTFVSPGRCGTWLTYGMTEMWTRIDVTDDNRNLPYESDSNWYISFFALGFNRYDGTKYMKIRHLYPATRVVANKSTVELKIQRSHKEWVGEQLLLVSAYGPFTLKAMDEFEGGHWILRDRSKEQGGLVMKVTEMTTKDQGAICSLQAKDCVGVIHMGRGNEPIDVRLKLRAWEDPEVIRRPESGTTVRGVVTLFIEAAP